jgi:rod shape determining protein RodA
VALVPIVINFGLKSYQYARITSFINPNYDPLGEGYNIIQALNAIGSGGLYGKGLNAPDSLNVLGYLPATIVQNDFVFSVMAEQQGFIGGVILISALGAVMLIGLFVALLAEDDLGRMIATGIVMMIFAHTLMNVGMNIGVTPITGLPLPFISYGGTFLMGIVAGMGLLQSIWVHRRQLREER